MPARAGMVRLLGHFLLDLLVYVLLAIAIVAAAVAVVFPSGALKPSYTGTHAIMVTLALVATALAGGLAWLFRRPGRGLALARGTVPAALVLALSVALLAQLLPRLLAWGGLPLAPSNAAVITRLFGEWPLVATVLVVLVAPLAEEAFFRGVLLRRFVVAGRPWAGLWLSAGVFALAHELFADGPWTQTLVTSATYLAMGMLFGAVYVRTGRLSAAFLAHAASNALALATVAFSGP
ncbi:MAG: CPBP family intramembrane metalloprotease [Rhizobium sp.]|nr:CPBP family intramembrane metalloprotease [Rhizobium sp.]